MIVICLSDCPLSVRGDLSKWLIEINTGVYVGTVNARVREHLWERICQNIKNGRATMVYSAAGEQKLAFKVHNTTWQPIDFEGLTLMKRPLPSAAVSSSLPENFSKAAQRQLHRKSLATEQRRKSASAECYAVVDVETTGLSASKHELLEIAALIVDNSKVTDTFHRLIKQSKPIPAEVSQLTGITEQECNEKGVPLSDAMEAFYDFIGGLRLVCHNAPFDSSFLRGACSRCGMPMLKNHYIDTLALCRRKLKRSTGLSLDAVAKDFKIEVIQSHRALDDCRTTMQVYEKLKML